MLVDMMEDVLPELVAIYKEPTQEGKVCAATVSTAAHYLHQRTLFAMSDTTERSDFHKL